VGFFKIDTKGTEEKLTRIKSMPHPDGDMTEKRYFAYSLRHSYLTEKI
jgi:hypothetical protein